MVDVNGQAGVAEAVGAREAQHAGGVVAARAAGDVDLGAREAGGRKEKSVYQAFGCFTGKRISGMSKKEDLLELRGARGVESNVLNAEEILAVLEARGQAEVDSGGV